MMFANEVRFMVCAAAVVLSGFLSTACADDGDKQNEKEEGPKPFSIDHLMALKGISDIQLSPEGDWVAYVVSRIDEKKDRSYSQIWMTSLDGETTLPLTEADAGGSRPRWNPDGSSIAFLGRRGSDKKAKTQVWTLDRRGGEAQPYTDVKDGVSGYEWAPDGSRMVLQIRDPEPGSDAKDYDPKKPKPYVIDRLQFKRDYRGYLDRRRTHLYLFEKGGKAEQITFGDYDDNSPKWSPDGSKIAFSSKRTDDPDANDDSNIFVVSAQAGLKERPLTQVTTNPGSDVQPAWSPDGTSIAHVSSYQPERLWYATERLAVSPAAGGEPTILTSDFDYMVRGPRYTADGSKIHFTAQVLGDNALMEVPAGGGDVAMVSARDVSIYGADFDDRGTLLTLESVHQSPTTLYATVKGERRQLTSLNTKVMETATLAKVERLKVKGWQGDMVESFVYYPEDYVEGTPHPTFFLLHGGPVSQHNSAFDNWAQIFAGKGYVVVLPNPHGSSGYGHDFTYALNRQWGVPDFADVDAIADHLVDAGIADPDKMGVGGWSYGGILTNYVITKTGRFAGAISGASVVNHRANYGHDHYQHYWEVEMGLPWEEAEAWERISPFNDIGKISTPTLVMGGAVDWNVPIQNSEQLYQGLKRRGIDTQLIVYPGEHHGIRKPSFRRDRLNRWIGWLNRTVKKLPDPEPEEAKKEDTETD